jgi:hypothetical protein
MKLRTMVMVSIGVALGMTAGTRDVGRAQTGTEPRPAVTVPSAASLLKGGAMGELLTVYVPRSQQDIQQLIETSKSLQRGAQEEIDDAKQIAQEADGRAKVMSEELETSQTKLKVAKTSKDKTASAELDGTIKRQKHELDYLQKLRAAASTDADRLKSEQSAVAARQKSLELELDVAKQHAALGAGTPSADAEAKYRAQLRNLLEAQRTAADRSSDAAKLLKSVADKRLKQLSSLAKISK